MKVNFCSVYFLMVLVSVSGKIVSTFGNDNIDDLWEDFKKYYNKEYISNEEHDNRKEIFTNNIERVERRNLINIENGGEEIFGVTKFSDLSQKEFDDYHKGRGFNC